MRILGAALTASVLLAFASPAQAGRWTESRTVASPGPSFGPDLAVNSRGDAVLGWSTRDSVWVAFAKRGSGFGKPRQLTGVPKPGGVRVDLDDRGNAAIGWMYDDETYVEEPELREDGCCDRLAGAVKPAGRSLFGPARTLSKAGIHLVNWDLAAAPDGGGFLWTEGDPYEGSDFKAAFGNARGTVGGSRKVLPAGDFAGVSILRRRDGSTTLAVSRGDGLLFERVRTPAGRFGPRRTIARRRRDDSVTRRWSYGRDQEFAVFDSLTTTTWSTRSRGGSFRTFRKLPGDVSAAGDVALDGSALSLTEVGEPPSLVAAYLAPGAPRFVAARQRIARHSRYSLISPVAAAANRGRGMAVWEVAPEEGPSRVFARRLHRGAPVGATRRLSIDGGPAHSPAAAATPSGRTYVAWVETGRIAVARYIP
jgi:hypothetical protein